MHILEEPVGGNFAAHPTLPGARQYFTAHGRKLQTESDIIAKTTDRLLIRAPRMLFVDQLGKSWKVPNRAVFARKRMLPTFGDIRNRLAVDADRDLKRFRLLPMNDQWIGAPISRRVELARLDTGDMNPGRQDLAVK